MVALRLLLIAGILHLGSSAFAADDQEMGIATDGMARLPYRPGQQRDKSGFDDDPRVQFRLLGGASFISTSLSGSGFGISLPYARGSIFGFEARYKPSLSSNLSIRGKFRRSSTQFQDLPSLSPSSIQTVESIGSLAFFGPLFEGSGGFLHKMMFGLGYWYGQRSADETTPNVALTSTRRHGITLGVEYVGALDTDFSLEAGLDFQLVNAFSESSVNTGFLSSSFAAELAAGVVYEITSVLSVSGGLRVRSDSASFTGAGSRGTTNGNDSTTGVYVPFEVRFKF